MSKSNPAANKTATAAKSRRRNAWLEGLFMLCLLGMSIQGVAAPQTQPIKPCVVEKPCTIETAPVTRQTSPAKRTSPSKRTAPRKPTPASKAGVATSPTVKGRVSEILVDSSVPDDPALEKIVTPYSAKVRALDVVIGKLALELKKGPVGAGNLGNFVADGIRAQSSAKLGQPVLLAVTNSGGLRKNTIAPGDLIAADIFELLPFENALAQVDLRGDHLLKLLEVVVSSGDALSGARIKYRMNANNRPELSSARLLDSQGREVEIHPNANYSVVTIDYLLKLGSGRYSVLQEAKNMRPLGITIRDALIEYVKAETAAGRPISAVLDGRFALSGPDTEKSEARPR